MNYVDSADQLELVLGTRATISKGCDSESGSSKNVDASPGNVGTVPFGDDLNH